MTVDRRALLGLAATGFASSAFGQSSAPASVGRLTPGLSQPIETIDLWPTGAPGTPANALIETLNERSTDAQLNDRAIFGISRPRMAVFRPVRPNGAAVLVTPGGGYRWVVIDKEGYEMGRWLAARGFTVFVTFYRLPGEGWASGPDVALCDAQRAMRLIRARAGEYGIDPERIAAMGFSAGGHVCADLSTRFAHRVYTATDNADLLSARPFVAAPIYPVISMSLPFSHAGSRERLIGRNASADLERAHSPQLNVPQDAPAHFIVHAEDDDVVPVENTLLFREALRAKKIAVETHLFAHGGHGFGIRKSVGKPVEAWPELFLGWARSQGLF